MASTSACATEAHTFCALDADRLVLLESAVERNEAKITYTRQHIRDCLVDHLDDLSSECIHALVGNLATSASVLAPATSTSTNTTETVADNNNTPNKQINAPQVNVVASSGQQQPQTQVTSDETGVEVRIFLINHQPPAAGTATQPSTPYIRIGGDSAQYTDNTQVASSGMVFPTWLWVALLPFVCIGMYVSVVQTVAFVRRRRDAVYRIGSSRYMPIPSSSGSSSSGVSKV